MELDNVCMHWCASSLKPLPFGVAGLLEGLPFGWTGRTTIYICSKLDPHNNVNFVTFAFSCKQISRNLFGFYFFWVFLMFLKYFYFGPGSSSNFFSLKGFFFFHFLNFQIRLVSILSSITSSLK